MDRGGLTRLSMADGKFAPFAGFDGLVLNGTAWAESKERFRNVVTGEERRIKPSPDAKFAKCEPAFCLVQTAAGWFLERLDGSDRTALPGTSSSRRTRATRRSARESSPRPSSRSSTGGDVAAGEQNVYLTPAD